MGKIKFILMEIKKPIDIIRNLIWPIQANEHKKLVPMFCLFFLVSFVYHLLRNMKIALIITLKGSGANIIPFLKIGCVLPSAIIATYIFTKLATKYNRERVFYYMVGGFLTYFLLFTFILFPNQDLLELHSIADFLKSNMLIANGFDGIIVIIRYWNIALFYVISELWSSVVLLMLTWGFANEITKMNEAKRFYAVFCTGINIAGIFMGIFSSKMISMKLPIVKIYHAEYQWVFYQLLTVIILSITVIAIFCYINKFIIKAENPSYLHPKEKPKISLYACIVLLKKSKYLIYIVLLVLSYNVVWNLADVIWSHRAKIAYPDSKSFYQYMNQVTMLTGIISTFFGCVISGAIIRNSGWKYSALVTPLVWLATGTLFYSAILFENIIASDIFATFVQNPTNIILILGTLQISLGRSCKYTIFDTTKEMCFIPLSKYEQRKSKAIVDGITSRLGKSFGSIFYIVLLIIFGNISATIPFVSVIIISLILLWIYSIFKLHELVPGIKESCQATNSLDYEPEISQTGKTITQN